MFLFVVDISKLVLEYQLFVYVYLINVLIRKFLFLIHEVNVLKTIDKRKRILEKYTKKKRLLRFYVLNLP